MELRGRLFDIVRDYMTGLFRITLEVGAIPSGIDAIRDHDLRINLTRWREKRSLSANAYYWVLVSKIADVISRESKEPVSTTEIHNELLRRYGQIEIIDGEPVTMFLPDTEEAEKRALKADTYHIKPTGHTRIGKDGRTYRAYRMLRGSSEYDSKEMSTLIDGTVAEAKHMGIETLPQEELERMMREYEVNHTNR